MNIEIILPEPLEALKFDELLLEQGSDPFTQSIRQALNNGKKLSFADDESSGLIVRRVMNRDRIVVPKTMTVRLLNLMYTPIVKGHSVEKSMYATL